MTFYYLDISTEGTARTEDAQQRNSPQREYSHFFFFHSALAQFKDFAESLDEEVIRVIEDEYDADFDLNSTEFIDKVLC